MMPKGPRSLQVALDKQARVLSGCAREGVGDVISTSQLLLVTCCLPFFDSLYRVDQHQDVQGRVVPDPESQRDLRQYKQRESASELRAGHERQRGRRSG